jgi:hypothetical protein
MNKILDDFHKVIGNLNKVEKYLESCEYANELNKRNRLRLELVRMQAERLYAEYDNLIRIIDDFNDRASEDLSYVWSDINDFEEEVDD